AVKFFDGGDSKFTEDVMMKDVFNGYAGVGV
ncbi:phage tail protein, partial [Klebsiella pneumoniae]